MSVGIAGTTLANKILDHLRGGTAWTQPAGLYVKLHKGDPGSAGTANPSAVTTRDDATFAAASSGKILLTGTVPSFAMTATEVITHVSIWDASTAGNFLWSAQLTVSKAVVSGDTVLVNSLTLAFVPLAA